MPAPDITVVIATCNRAGELTRTLEHLLAMPEHPEIVVVDNGSVDATSARVAAAFPAVRVVALPTNLGAAARTIGARVAKTPFIAFADDDSWWTAGSLVHATAILRANPWRALVAGRVLVGEDCELDPVSRAMAAGSYDETYSPSPEGRRGVTGFLGCAAVVRRAAFLAVGGFDVHLLIGGEEELVALRLVEGGWRLVYGPEATVRHFPSERRNRSRRRVLVERNGVITAVLALPLPEVARRVRHGRAVREAWHLGAWAVANRAPVCGSVRELFRRQQEESQET